MADAAVGPSPTPFGPSLSKPFARASTSPARTDVSARALARADEVRDLEALLLDHVAAGTPEGQARTLAHAIAIACLGDRHLWEDLGLPSRDALWLLMQRWFPGLVAKNHARMRWKKFLYRELCIREQVLVCRSPSCDVCPEKTTCFAPEDATTSCPT